MTIKNGLSIRAYNSPLPIVNLQLSKALTDTFYDPRASSLPVTPPPPPLPPHTPPTKHLLAPQGGVQFQTSRVNCKNVECFRPFPPFSPPLFSLHLIRVASSVGDCFNGRRPWRVSAAGSRWLLLRESFKSLPSTLRYFLSSSHFSLRSHEESWTFTFVQRERNEDFSSFSIVYFPPKVLLFVYFPFEIFQKSLLLILNLVLKKNKLTYRYYKISNWTYII